MFTQLTTSDEPLAPPVAPADVSDAPAGCNNLLSCDFDFGIAGSSTPAFVCCCSCCTGDTTPPPPMACSFRFGGGVVGNRFDTLRPLAVLLPTNVLPVDDAGAVAPLDVVVVDGELGGDGDVGVPRPTLSSSGDSVWRRLASTAASVAAATSALGGENCAANCADGCEADCAAVDDVVRCSCCGDRNVCCCCCCWTCCGLPTATRGAITTPRCAYLCFDMAPPPPPTPAAAPRCAARGDDPTPRSR